MSAAAVLSAPAAGAGRTAGGSGAAAGGGPTLSISLVKDCMVVGTLPPAWETSQAVSCK